MRPYGGLSSGSPCGEALVLTALSFVVAVAPPVPVRGGASAPTFSPGPEMYRTPVSTLPDTYGMSENSLFGGGSSPRIGIDVYDGMYAMCVSGSNEPPGQLVPPDDLNPAIGPSALLTGGGVKMGPVLYRAAILTASARSSGVKSIRLSSVTP